MTDNIDKAFKLVYKLEPTRYRKFSPLPEGKEIYWTHLYSVYKLCVYWVGYDEELLVAAILHDILEDTDYGMESLVNEFGSNVAEIVSLCTKKKTYVTFDITDTNEYFTKIMNYPNTAIRKKTMIIKLADRLDNLLGASFIEDRQIKSKYLKETIDYYTPIAQELKMNDIFSHLLRYSELVINN